MIRTIEIREEEVEDKDIEEEVSMGNVFTTEKGIEQQKVRPELHMLMKMADHYILKMLKEERF